MISNNVHSVPTQGWRQRQTPLLTLAWSSSTARLSGLLKFKSLSIVERALLTNFSAASCWLSNSCQAASVTCASGHTWARDELGDVEGVGNSSSMNVPCASSHLKALLLWVHVLLHFADCVLQTLQVLLQRLSQALLSLELLASRNQLLDVLSLQL